MEGDPVARSLLPYLPVEIGTGADLLQLHFDDDVSLLEAALLGRPSGNHARDNDVPSHVLRIKAEPGTWDAAAHPPVLLQLLLVPQIEFNGYGEREFSDVVQVEGNDSHQPAPEVR